MDYVTISNGGNGVMIRFEQIASTLETQIRSGKISGKLPSEKELAARFSVAGMTMSRAMDVLKSRGLIHQIHRQGSFVIPPQKKVLRLLKSSRCYFAGREQHILLEKFPDISFEIVESLDEADIAVFPTILPMNYSSHFMPWPQEIIRKLKDSGKYFNNIFEYHHVGTPVYAVPYSFSPCLLAFNKKLMKKYAPGFDCNNFSMDALTDLLDKVPEELRPASQETNRLILSIAYTTGSLSAALNMLKKLRLPAKSSASPGERIFTVITRKDIFDTEIQNTCMLMPMPSFNGNRCCHTVSESVFVPLGSRHPETAFQLAAHTLSDHFQQHVAEISDNLPANRKTALENKCSGKLNDDIFFSETVNIHYPREIIDPLSTAVILLGLKEFAGNRLSVEDFIKLLKNEEENIRRREKAIENILQNQFQF